jgi:hypothetical protein
MPTPFSYPTDYAKPEHLNKHRRFAGHARGSKTVSGALVG